MSVGAGADGEQALSLLPLLPLLSASGFVSVQSGLSGFRRLHTYCEGTQRSQCLVCTYASRSCTVPCQGCLLYCLTSI